MRSSAIAQESLTLLNLDATGFPTVRADAHVLGEDGAPIPGLLPADFSVIENGIARTVTRVECPEPRRTEPISMVLAIDISKSMAQGGPRMDVAKAAASALIQALPSGGSECAVTSFDTKSYINQDFTTDRAKLLAAVNALTPQEGTDYFAALIGDPSGAISVAKGGRYKRIIIFLSDGDGSGMADPIAKVANDNNVTIYTVGLGIVASDILKGIATQTGGTWFDRIETRQDAEAIYRAILQKVLGRGPCTIEWRSDVECNVDRDVVVRIPARSLEARLSYRAGETGGLGLRANPIALSYGFVDPPGWLDLDFTLTAQQRPVYVSTITSDDPRFTVLSPVPFTIGAGGSRTIRIRYTASDSNYVFATIAIESDACSQTLVYASAGFPGLGPTKPTLRILGPNGRERIPAGGDTAITWTGVLSTETVLLEFSTDKGASWTEITDTARGLRYVWRVPTTPSDQCLIRAVQLSNRSPDDPLTLSGVHTRTVRSAAFSPDGRRVVTGSDDRRITIWDAATGMAVDSLQGHNDWVSSVDYSPDGGRIISGAYDYQAIIWDVAAKAPIHSLVHARNVTSAHFSDDGEYVVTACHDGAVRIWKAQTGQLLRTLTGHRNEVFAARFSPDGQYIVSAGKDSTVRIWMAQDGTLVRTLNQGSQVNDARFSPDGQQVISGSDDGKAKIWSAQSGSLLRTLSGHNNRVYAVSFSPDRRLLMTAGDDGVAKLWNAPTGSELRTLVGHTSGILSAGFSRDGRAIVTGSRDITAKVWSVDIYTLQEDISDTLWSVVRPKGVGAKVDFGQVVVKMPKDTIITELLKNDSDVPLEIRGMTVNGTDAGDFHVVSGGAPFVIPVGATKEVELRFHPSAVGIRRGQLSSRTTTGEFILQELEGEGIVPAAQAVPLINFGQVHVSAWRDTTVDVMLKNTGVTTIAFTATTMLGPGRSQFSVQAGGGAFMLQPGESRTVTVRFAPTAVGRTSGSLGFEYAGGGPAVVDLAGEGILPLLTIGDSVVMAPLICDSFRDTVILVGNIGESALTISLIGLDGPGADAFSLADHAGAPLVFPLRLYPGEVDTIAVHAVPGAPGEYRGRLTLQSNAANRGGEDFSIPISIRKDSVGFELSESSLQFDMPDAGVAGTARVKLKNTGTLPLAWDAPIVLGEFIVESVTPIVTPPGGESDVVIRYVGGPEGAIADTSYEFVDTICGRTARLTLGATVARVGFAVLVLPEGLTAAPGETVDVSVQLRNARRLEGAVDGFSANLRFDAALLYPIEGTPKGIVVGSDRVIPLSLPLPPSIGPDSVIAVLKFRATLGAELSTPLQLEGPVAVGGKAVTAQVPGRFTLSNLCEVGGTRFIRSGTFTLKPSRPNPSGSEAEIEFEVVEDGRTRLTLTDASGAAVMTIFDGDLKAGRYASRVDVSTLPSGPYFYTLETATQRLTERMTVER